MSIITREQLRERARAKVKSLEFSITQTAFADSRAELEEELDLARIALASLEAEPVSVFKIDHESSLIKHVKRVVSETNAPPAPVSVKDNRAITPHFETISLLLSREIMYDVNRRHEFPGGEIQLVSRIQCKIDDAFRDAMLQGADGNSPVIPDCSCGTSRPVTFTDSRFVVCSECGNKRCPHANDHRNACTGSNEPGQEGSAYPAAPQQDTSRELFVSVEGDSCSKHPDTQLINHPHRQTASIPPHPVKYCPKCELGVLPLKAFRIPDEWIFGAHTNCLTISCSVKSDKKITFVNSSFVNCSEPEGDIQFINCTLPAEWEGKVNAIDCVFKAAPQQEVK